MTSAEAPQASGMMRGRIGAASGGLFGALTARSCCLLPVVLFMLGVVGAWIGTPVRLAPRRGLAHFVKENPMVRLLVAPAFFLVISCQSTFAAQQTVTLTVNNMYCEACPYMVKKTLEGISGVSKVTVSFKDKTAVVVFEDTKATLQYLTGATTKAGFPSQPKN